MAEVINVTPEVPKEDPNHEQEMINKADGVSKQEEDEQQQQQEQQLLAGKYKTEEDLQKGTFELLKKQYGVDTPEELYKKLESTLGDAQKPSETETTEQEVKTSDDAQQQSTEDADSDEFDFTPYEQEMAEKGELTEDSYKALKEAGYPKQVVDRYLEGMKALADRETQQIYSITEGQDNYTSMIEWAEKGLSETEQQAFNTALNAGLDSAKFAVEALYNRFTKSDGAPPKGLISGNASANSSADKYESRAQLTADMNNPLYATDTAFQKKVHDKLGRSDIF